MNGEQRYLRLVCGSSYPDPNRPEVISDARTLGDHATDVGHRYEIVQLYLSEDEANEASVTGLEEVFIDFQNLSASIVRQELNARNVLEYSLAANIMCESLPRKLAAWFRNSEVNKLSYVLKLADIKYQWVTSPEELWLMREHRGKSLEERDETPSGDRPLRLNSAVPL